MKTIHKFPVKSGLNELELPAYAQVLDVQMQHGSAQMWVLLDPSLPKKPRSFAVYGTGWDMPADPGNYLATFQMNGGHLVFHVFEATP